MDKKEKSNKMVSNIQKIALNHLWDPAAIEFLPKEFLRFLQAWHIVFVASETLITWLGDGEEDWGTLFGGT